MIHFFYGEDTYSLHLELVKRKEQFVKQNGQAGVESIEFDERSLDDEVQAGLRQAFETDGLFSKRKFIILKNFVSTQDLLPKSQVYLMKFLEESKPDLEILIAELAPFDRRRKLFKELATLTKAVEFEKPTDERLQIWIEKYLLKFSYQIQQEALFELMARVRESDNMWQIASELDKLILFSPPGKSIGVEEVRKIVSSSLSYGVFDLTNSVAQGKIKQAHNVLEQLVDEGATQKTQAIQVIGALSSQLHSLLAVKSLTGSAKEKAAALGWKEGRVWINEKLSTGFAMSKLKQLISDLKQIDFRAKTTDEPIKLLLSLFIQKARS